MANCANCNLNFEKGLKFCSDCGAPAEAPVRQGGESADFSARVAAINNTADSTSEYDVRDIENNKIMAVLAYIIFLVPLLAAKDSPFAKFHTNQGFVLFLGGIISSVVAVVPIIGWIIAPLAALGITVLAVIGIINALGGKAKELPLIGKFRIIK